MSGFGVRVVTIYIKPVAADEAGFEPALPALQTGALPLELFVPKSAPLHLTETLSSFLHLLFFVHRFQAFIN